MSKIPTYSLGAVLRETEMKPDTLRAWERRYNLPQPMRSDSGHRLYTQRDIEIIKWLLAQQEGGTRIGQAVKLWQSKVEQGVDPLRENDRSEALFADSVDQASQLVHFRQAWIDACLDFDEDRAEQTANETFSRLLPETALLEVFTPAIRRIGELWYEGKANIQQEHFASALLLRRLNALINNAPPPTRPEKIIVGCPPNEEHDLSLLFFNFFLRRRGFHVIYLGRNVPEEEFRETALAIQPNMVALAVQQLTTAATLEAIAREFIDTDIPIAYSGRIFTVTPVVRQYIHAHFLGNQMTDAFNNIEKLFKQAPKNDFALEKNPYENLHARFKTYHASVHSKIMKMIAHWQVPIDKVNASTTYLNENVAAALYLGNLDLLAPELEWVKHLLRHRQVSPVRLERFLYSYAEAVDTALGEDGEPLSAWFREQAAHYASGEKRYA